LKISNAWGSLTSNSTESSQKSVNYPQTVFQSNKKIDQQIQDQRREYKSKYEKKEPAGWLLEPIDQTFNVSTAVWIASSSSIFSLYLKEQLLEQCKSKH